MYLRKSVPLMLPSTRIHVIVVPRSIARLRVAEMDFIHDIEKDDFLKELEVAINQFRWLLGLPYFPNQRASGQLFERTRKMAESTSLGIFTERTKKLIEPTIFRVFTERTKKLAEPTRLRILTERTKQRLWLLLIENPRNNLF